MRKVGKSIQDSRLRFKRGLQRRFLLKIKEKSGLTWKNLADQVNVCEHTFVVDWLREKSTLPLTIAENLIGEFPFEKWAVIKSNWVLEILPSTWRQDKVAFNIKKRITLPKESEYLAELFGAILGDGHLERKSLIITGNSFEVEHYIYLTKKVKELFGIDARISKLKNQNTMNLKVNSVELIKFLIQNDFVLGNKIKNKESLPDWIFGKKEFIFGAIRGLFDTDGGIYQKQKKYNRAIIEFQTKSPYIRKNILTLLEKGGFTSSKSVGNIRIQNQNEVHKFYSLIGSSNPKNIARYLHFIKNGEIPLKEFLKEEISNIKVKVPFKCAISLTV